MRKKFDYTFNQGLPGGANQVKGRVKGSVTKTGYKRNSPDVNNDFNVIPSPYITMVGVDFPVYGEDNLGNGHMMYPGNEYMFPGDYVTELPAYGDGGLKQWFAEKWVDIKTGKECGRSGKDKNGRPYPACRPSRRVNKSTPKTVGELSSAEKAKFKREKTSGERIDYNHTAQEGVETVAGYNDRYGNYVAPGDTLYSGPANHDLLYRRMTTASQDSRPFIGDSQTTTGPDGTTTVRQGELGFPQAQKAEFSMLQDGDKGYVIYTPEGYKMPKKKTTNKDNPFYNLLKSGKESVNSVRRKFQEGGSLPKAQEGVEEKPAIDPSLLNPALTAKLSQVGPQPIATTAKPVGPVQAAEPVQTVPTFTAEDEAALRRELLDSANPLETNTRGYGPVSPAADYLASDDFAVSEELANTVYDPLDVTGRYTENVNSQVGYNLQDLNDKYYKKYTAENKTPVYEIQEELLAKGFLSENEVDGMYGPKTQKAVKAYNNSLNALKINSDLIPAKLDDSRCAAGMCSILEDQGVNTSSLGLKYKNAWDMLESTQKANSAEVVYNIYDAPEFQTVKSAADIKDATRSVKRRSQTSSDMYKVGDIVGIYWPNSTHHAETIGSKTNNTHVGFVSGIDENGQPIITHNVGGNVKQDRWDNLVTGWISRPTQSSQVNVQYNAEDWQDVDIPDYVISNFEQKIERPLSESEAGTVRNVLKRVSYNAETLPGKLGSDVDSQWLRQAVSGVLGNETALGLNVKRSKDEVVEDDVFRKVGYVIKGVEDEDISLGMGKVKFSSLDPFSKQFFDINSEADLGDDNKNIDVTTYNMIKHYDMFKNYANEFPQLGLTEDDIRNMAILSHNQGTSKLLRLGRNKDLQTVQQEVQRLRELYDSESSDISSTNYRYLGAFGNLFGDSIGDVANAVGRELYNAENAIKGEKPTYESYISKANRYGDWLYNKTDDVQYPTLYDFMKGNNMTPSYSNREKIYKDFFEDEYQGTVEQNRKLLEQLRTMQRERSSVS